MAAPAARGRAPVVNPQPLASFVPFVVQHARREADAAFAPTFNPRQSKLDLGRLSLLHAAIEAELAVRSPSFASLGAIASVAVPLLALAAKLGHIAGAKYV